MEVEKELFQSIFRVMNNNIHIFDKYDITLFGIMLFIIIGTILILVLRNLLDI